MLQFVSFHDLDGDGEVDAVASSTTRRWRTRPVDRPDSDAGGFGVGEPGFSDHDQRVYR